MPVAIVADRSPDRALKAIRVYHSMWPLTSEHAVRSPLLPADPDLHAEGVVGDYQRALAEGDLQGIVSTFEPDGYTREPSGGAYLHRGVERLRTLYEHMFANGGGIPLEHCTLTDDGVRCAIEYNCVRWGMIDIPPEAGVAVYERGPAGCSRRRASTTTSSRQPSRTRPPNRPDFYEKAASCTQFREQERGRNR